MKNSHLFKLHLFTSPHHQSLIFPLQLKRSRETEVQLKPLVEKNKRLNKKNENMLQSIQRMEEKIKNLSRENIEMVSGCFLHLT